MILRNNTKVKTTLFITMLLVVAACGGSDSGAGGDLIPTAEPPGPPVSDIPGALAPEAIPAVKYVDGKFVEDSMPADTWDNTTRIAKSNYTIAYNNGWAAIDFTVKITENLKEAAAASGVTIVGFCDMEFSPEKAITCAEQSVTLNPDFVIHSNFQGGLSGEQSMEIFDAAGVPVAVVDVWHPNSIFFGADNYAAGVLGGRDAGKYAADNWGCEDVHILLGENPPEGEAADLRMVGFRDGVRAYCGIPDTKVHRINLDGTADQAITATTDWLTANPDAGYVLCGTIDDERASGMARALTQAGREGGCVGQGADLPGTSLIHEGSIEETKYISTVAYYPERYGEFLVNIAIDVIEGRPVPQEVHMQHMIIDRSNVDEFYPQG